MEHDSRLKNTDTTFDLEIFNTFEKQICHGSSETAKDILELFLTKSPEYVDALALNLANVDVNGLYFNAHTQKSSSAVLGFSRLSNLCAEVENSALTGAIEITELNSNISAIAQEFKAVQNAVVEYFDKTKKIS